MNHKNGNQEYIHLFAALHGVVALACQLTNVQDELLLTLLTMTLVVLLCIRKGLSVEFTAVAIVIVNVLGYILGIGGAQALGHIVEDPRIIFPVSTMVTTEIVGWFLLWIGNIYIHLQNDEGNHPYKPANLRWLIISFATIFALRIGLLAIFSTNLYSNTTFLNVLADFMGNTFAFVMLVCFSIIHVRFIKNSYSKESSSFKWFSLLIFIVVIAAIAALMAGYGLPFNYKDGLTSKEFLQLLVISTLVEVTTYAIIDAISFVISNNLAAKTARDNANLAQFRYIKLKQQVNPHFLFNSLNILDSLVVDGQSKEASSYIHKLANIYRYMISSEDETLVKLKDEMEFTEAYIDLLKVRFQNGLNVDIRIDEEEGERLIVPCSIQLLIENATKHNSVSESQPLNISVAASGGNIVVRNNLQIRTSSMPSSKLGLKYIVQQYVDIAGKEVSIKKTATEYIVSIPLL